MKQRTVPIVKGDTAVLGKKELTNLLENLKNVMPVFGVREKQGKYVFDVINEVSEMVFDYDVTVLPPTMFLFPPRETILEYKTGIAGRGQTITETAPRAIVGVHPYDIKAIAQLDRIFADANQDEKISAKRVKAQGKAANEWEE